MKCPQCRDEFRDDITTCPDCGVALVAELPPLDHGAPEMVSVLTTLDGTELMAARGALESAGIEYSLDDPGATPGASFGGSLDPAGEPTEILVPKDQAEAARKVLSGAG